MLAYRRKNSYHQIIDVAINLVWRWWNLMLLFILLLRCILIWIWIEWRISRFVSFSRIIFLLIFFLPFFIWIFYDNAYLLSYVSSLLSKHIYFAYFDVNATRPTHFIVSFHLIELDGVHCVIRQPTWSSTFIHSL